MGSHDALSGCIGGFLSTTLLLEMTFAWSRMTGNGNERMFSPRGFFSYSDLTRHHAPDFLEFKFMIGVGDEAIW
jgi:hypothetical protein